MNDLFARIRNFRYIWIMPGSKDCNLSWVRIINIIIIVVVVVLKFVHANCLIQDWIHVCIPHLILKRILAFRGMRKGLFVWKKAYIQLNSILFHFMYTIFVRALNVITTQFPPFCDRSRRITAFGRFIVCESCFVHVHTL